MRGVQQLCYVLFYCWQEKNVSALARRPTPLSQVRTMPTFWPMLVVVVQLNIQHLFYMITWLA